MTLHKMAAQDKHRWGYATFEPDTGMAGGIICIRLHYQIGEVGMQTGCSLQIRPLQKVASTWAAGQTAFPAAPNYITAHTNGPAQLLVNTQGSVVEVHVVAGELTSTHEVTITYGDQSGGSPGWEMKPIAHRIPFRLYLRTRPEVDFVEIPTSPVYFEVKPNTVQRIEVIAPSIVQVGEAFEVQTRLVDEYGNTAEANSGQISISSVNVLQPYEKQLSDTVQSIQRFSYQALAPLSEPFQLDVKTDAGLHAKSNPIACKKNSEQRIYWGDLHCHTDIGQALETPEFLYGWAQTEAKLDFLAHVEHFAATPGGWIGHEWSRYETQPKNLRDYIKDTWEHCNELVRQNYTPGKFVTFLGFEWASNIYGHMNVIYAKDAGEIYYPAGFLETLETPTEIWKALASCKSLSIPHHPSHPVYRSRVNRKAVGGWDWNFYHPYQVRLVEIYSKHGASESFGGPYPIPDQGPEGCVVEALRRGYRIGFVGSSDSHSSRPGSYMKGDLYYPSGGLTAVFSKHLDRESIYEALARRQCYATTGARIQLYVSLNGHPMGSDFSLDSNEQPREIDIKISGTENIEYVDVIRNGEVFNRFTCGWKPQSNVSVFSTDHTLCEGMDYYYVRVVQKDGHMAWSSPIFVTARGEF